MTRSAWRAHRCKPRLREAAISTAWVLGLLACILLYEVITGDTVTRADIQTVRAALVAAIVLFIVGLAVRYAISGKLWELLRGLAARGDWAELTRMSVCTVSVPVAFTVTGLAVWLERITFTESVVVFMLSWAAVIVWAGVVMFVADEPAHGIPDQRSIVNRMLIRGALPIVVATSILCGSSALSVFDPGTWFTVAVGLGYAVCAVLWCTLVLLEWPQRLLARQLRRSAGQSDARDLA